MSKLRLAFVRVCVKKNVSNTMFLMFQFPIQKEVTGFIWHAGDFGRRGNGVHAYFVAKFNCSFAMGGIWNAGNIRQGVSSVVGKDVGAFIEFANDAYVEMAVGVSWVSLEQARANLQASSPATFDAVHTQAVAAWEKALGVV
jgi:putative alpha-1,2-mannosidase